MSYFSFHIEKELEGTRARVGVITTPHGIIETPAFAVVGTKGTVKTLSPEEVSDCGAQVVLANTYHLYLEPGEKTVGSAGGLGGFMNWPGPTITDSGGFQVFSLGAAFGKGIGKLLRKETLAAKEKEEDAPTLVTITDEGVEFKSHLDGSSHFFTPEKSIQIQKDINADIIFSFDECTSPLAGYEYQKKALGRTHEWAKRSLTEHERNPKMQALFGVVQGGRFLDLRRDSARFLGELPFDGFGIGGSFEKEDIEKTLGAVNDILPKKKPRHLLGIGEPEDLFAGICEGVDLFDCVAPTRIARNGQLYTKDGKINILNARFRNDSLPIEDDCGCYACKNFSRMYLAHLFRAREIFGLRLASIHNVHFIVQLVRNIRASILDGTFKIFQDGFLKRFTAAS